MLEKTMNPIEGYFKIEVLKDDKVTDVFEDHNTICINARLGMAKIFSNILSNVQKPFACRLALGTCGVTKSRFTPRIENTTYTRDITRLFTEQYADDDITAYEGQTADVLEPYKIYKYGDSYYRYISPDNPASHAITTSLLLNSSVFQKDYYPYLYTVPFNITDKVYKSSDLGYQMKIDDNSKAQCEAYVNIVDTIDATDNDGELIDNFKSTVKFTWIIPKPYANSQVSADEFETQMTFFSEAGIYINDTDLFCYRAFPTKVKDSSTALRITWKIVF